MQLWLEWFRCVSLLRSACRRQRTFLWMTLCLLGFSIRSDCLGVTSFVRAGFLRGLFYRRLLHLFHTDGLVLEKLTAIWVSLVKALFTPLVEGGRLVLVGDGLKVSKEGRKMPSVKSLHQESSSNSKRPYIMGHSFQALGMLVKGPVSALFSVPLISRIHEGLVFSNRDQRTLLDKLVSLFFSIEGYLEKKAILLLDAYYASKKVVSPLLSRGHHVVTRLRSNAVAHLPAKAPRKRERGRPRLYGKKVKLRDFFNRPDGFTRARSPAYQQEGTLRYLSKDLVWRPIGQKVRFIFILHDTGKKLILMTTLLDLEPLDVIRLYSYRFKIEASFKQSLHTVGAYAYRFWMKGMTRIRRGQGDQYLHRTSEAYRNGVRRKIRAYHRHVQLGLIAQGLLQHLSIHFRHLVWRHFRSWMRTMPTRSCPSEMVTAQALRSSLPEFLVTYRKRHKLEKFIATHADLSRVPGIRASA